MIQLGFVSAILPELSLRQVLELAAEIGYDCVEVMCWPPSKAERRYAGVTHLDLTRFGDELVREVASLVSSTGISLSALGYYPNCLSNNPTEAESAVAHLKRVIEAAPSLDCLASRRSSVETIRFRSRTTGPV